MLTGLPRGPELPGYPVQAQNPPLLSTQAKGVNQAKRDLFFWFLCRGIRAPWKRSRDLERALRGIRGEARELSAPHGNRNTFFLETVSSRLRNENSYIGKNKSFGTLGGRKGKLEHPYY